MKKLIFIIYFLSLMCYGYAETFTQIEFYKGGRDNIKLSPIPKEIEYKLQLKGTVKSKNLLIQITYVKKNKERQVQLKLSNNSFDYYYLLKEGAGLYKINIFGNEGGLHYEGLCYFEVTSKKELPSNLKELNINEKIIDYVKSVEGKLVGRGECWDLASYALNYAKADWVAPLDYGIPLDLEKDEILPGDIIQMRSVVFAFENKTEYYGNPDHTAIVYEVLGKKDFIIAQQNAAGKRYVTIDKFNLNYMKQGSIKFYRPVAGLIEP